MDDGLGQDELRVMIALVRKLGGEVELTMKDLMDAEDYTLERCESLSFISGMRLRSRLTPVTLEGETVSEVLELPRG